MKFFRVWICKSCKQYKIYMVAQDRPICPVCGNMLFRAPAAATHLLFPTIPVGGTQREISRKVPPQTDSEILGAPPLVALGKDMKKNSSEEVHTPPKKRGRKKRDEK